MNIFVSQHKSDSWDDFLTSENLEYLHSLGNVTINESEKPLTEDQLCEAIRDQDVLITCWGVPKISERVLENANRLKFIGHLAGSVAYLVGDAVYDKGIRVVCGNEAFAESVAEGTMAYILAVNPNILSASGMFTKKAGAHGPLSTILCCAVRSVSSALAPWQNTWLVCSSPSVPRSWSILLI